MKSLQQKSQVHACLLVIVLVMLVWIQAATAQLSLSTPTDGVQCYGDSVTLVCTHPVLPQEPEYLQADVTWRRNGTAISTVGLGRTKLNSTTTRLQFTITEDTVGNYTCFLVNAVRGGADESNSAPVIPLDQLPIPKRASTFFTSTTAVLTLSFNPQCCNTSQLNVTTTNSSSATTPLVHPVDSTDPTNTTIVITDITEGVCYTASIWSVCEDNNLLEDSGVLVVDFNGPPEVTITTTDSTITLTWNTALRCFESEIFTFVVIWNEIGSGTSSNVTTSSSPYTISGLQPDTSYQISVLVVDESGVISRTTIRNVATLAETPTGGDYPTTGVVIAVVITVAIAVVVSVIIFVVVVIAIVLVVAHCWKTRVQGDYDTGSSALDPDPPASSKPFSSGLYGTCSYAEVNFESSNPTPIPPPPVEGVTYAEPVDVGEKETNDGESIPEFITKQQHHHNNVSHVVEAKQVTGSTKGLLISNQPTIPSEWLLTLEDAGCQFVPVSGYGEEGWEDRMIDKFKDVFPKVPNDDSESKDVDTSPELPPKQDQQQIEAFRDDVKAVLDKNGVICKDLKAEKLKGIKREFTFAAEYNGIHFVTICVSTSSDLNINHVHMVIEAMGLTGSTTGLLISNQPTIPSECLLTLEGAGCQFVPVSGYGEEGWEDRMIDKFKDVFSKVANDESKSEDLPTSEQGTCLSETGVLPCVIQQRTGSALVQNDNSHNNNITVKRWNAHVDGPGVSVEDCVKSWKGTPLHRYDCPVSFFRGSGNEELMNTVKTKSATLDDQNVYGIFYKISDDDSESEDLPTSEQVVDSSPMVLPKCPPPPMTSPPPDYQGGYSGISSDDSKTHNNQFRSPDGCTMTIVSGQYSVYMPPITSGLFMSPFEYKVFDEEEVFHKKRTQREEVEEEEAMPIPVQETTLTTCPPPSTAVSIANLEYPEEPLPTAASVASGECPEILPMTLTESSHEYPNVLKADDSHVSPEPDSLDSIIVRRIAIDLPPVDPTPAQFSGKTYGFLGVLETAQDPHQQNWGLWTGNKAESVQYTSIANGVVHNNSRKLCYTLVYWSAHLFKTALHHSGAFFVV